MENNVLVSILRERELRGERVVSIARFSFISFAFLMDVLAYYGLAPPISSSGPDGRTLLLDLLFWSAANLFLILALRRVYAPFLKYITITADYVLLTVMFLFDPAIPREAPGVVGLSLIAAIFLFFLNLLRYSRGAMVYAGALSVASTSSSGTPS